MLTLPSARQEPSVLQNDIEPWRQRIKKVAAAADAREGNSSPPIGSMAGFLHLKAHKTSDHAYPADVMSRGTFHRHHVSDFQVEPVRICVESHAGILEHNLHYIEIIARGYAIERP